MQAQATPNVDAAQLAVIKKKLQFENQVRGGAAWFYWIGGLSLVNSAAYLLGIQFALLFGLGITQAIDGILTGVIKASGPDWGFLHAVGFGIDICIAGMFALMGYFGQKRVRWPVIVGMVLYTLDGLLMLLLRAYIGAAFHLLALLGLWGGLMAMRGLDVLEHPLQGESAEALLQRSIPRAAQRPKATPEQIRLRWILIGLILLVPIVLCVIIGLQQR
jgi:hypothetical protein